MSIATVVLRGYGTGSYADVNKLPTLGYSIGEQSQTTIVGPARVLRSVVSVAGSRAAAVSVVGVRQAVNQ